MGRPRKIIKSIEKTICLDEDLVDRVELELLSSLTGKVPFGAWREYVTRLISEDLAKRDQSRTRNLHL